MTFVEREAWPVMWENRARAPVLPGMPLRLASPAWQRFDPHARRFAGSLISALMHAGFLWLFLNALSDGSQDGRGSGDSGRGLSVIDLARPEDAGQASPSAQPPAPPVQPEVDLSAPTELPPPEWTISRMRVARPAVVATISAPAIVGAPPGAGGMGGSAGGGGTYDPYAGAAPLRRESGGGGQLIRTPEPLQPSGLASTPSIARISDASFLPSIAIDRGRLRALCQRLAGLPVRAFELERVMLDIAPDGAIRGARQTRMPPATQSHHLLQKAVMGVKLYKVRNGFQGGEVALPRCK